jgi:hypothetical protein
MNGIYIYVCESKRDVEIEVENLSSPPLPIVISYEISNTKNVEFPLLKDKKFILPSENSMNKMGEDPLERFQKMIENIEKENTVKKTDTKVVKVNPQTLSESWSFSINVTYTIANSMEDFVEWENEQKLKQIEEMKNLLGEEKEFQLIKSKLDSFGKKFIDAEFPPTNKSLYIDLTDLPKKIFPIQWKRPEEFFKIDKIPKMFTNQASSEDIKQGKLGGLFLKRKIYIFFS